MIHKFLVLALSFAVLISCSSPKEYDLCIYGGSASGVVAAYAAAQSGLNVVVVEPSSQIGGMITGGLGQTDIGNKQVVKGLGLDFFRKIGAHYGALEGWVFEPSVASEIMEQYASHRHIKIVTGHHLCSVEKNGTQIISFKTTDGTDTLSFRGKCFADCSYEGDLMAMAGVSYRIGREDNAEYGETWDGVQCLNGHQFPDGVDPFVVPGKPESGLLWGISPETMKPNGTGDTLTQAYNYRICLTDSLENMIPIAKPENYDPSRYELLLRLFEAQPEKRALNDYFIWSPMPNRKTDINNRGGFSTDMIGANHRYSEASWEERKEIIKAHTDYTLGLLYFCANDERVPAEFRAQVAKWGLPKDEYVNNGHWTPQLYVRECRRMVGEYVATQADCENRTVVPDGVAAAAYTMDSHNCERVVVNKNGRLMVKNEGNAEIKGGLPYPISYRSITPKREECTNLLVTICLSASHIAYGSIRMEPVFMCLGQVAGMAASLYLKDGLDMIQQVDYARINASIAEDPYMDGSQPDILIDDPQATVEGEWEQVVTRKAFGRSFYKGSDGFVEFSTTVPSKGKYDIYSYHLKKQGKTAYDFFDGEQVLVNPEDANIVGQTNGAWHRIRTVDFKKGDTFTVKVHGVSGEITSADAILLVKNTKFGAN